MPRGTFVGSRVLTSDTDVKYRPEVVDRADGPCRRFGPELRLDIGAEVGQLVVLTFRNLYHRKDAAKCADPRLEFVCRRAVKGKLNGSLCSADPNQRRSCVGVPDKVEVVDRLREC